MESEDVSILYYLWLLNKEMAQVVYMLPQGDKTPFIFLKSALWHPDDLAMQGIRTSVDVSISQFCHSVLLSALLWLTCTMLCSIPAVSIHSDWYPAFPAQNAYCIYFRFGICIHHWPSQGASFFSNYASFCLLTSGIVSGYLISKCFKLNLFQHVYSHYVPSSISI